MTTPFAGRNRCDTLSRMNWKHLAISAASAAIPPTVAALMGAPLNAQTAVTSACVFVSTFAASIMRGLKSGATGAQS